MPQRAVEAPSGAAASRTSIIVARRGWHIDIGFRTADVQGPLASLSAQFVHSQYVFFGFGDRHYLVANNKNFPGLMAALWPEGGVILVTMLRATSEEAFGTGHAISLTVNSAEALAAQAFVWNSLLKADGVPVFYREGPYAGSLFFAAVPKYSAVHTCNTWAAEGLRAAGLPIHSRGVLFASQLWSQIRRIEDTMAANSDRDAAVRLTAFPAAPTLARDHDRMLAAH